MHPTPDWPLPRGALHDGSAGHGIADTIQILEGRVVGDFDLPLVRVGTDLDRGRTGGRVEFQSSVAFQPLGLAGLLVSVLVLRFVTFIRLTMVVFAR